jgi:hypothetical protein
MNSLYDEIRSAIHASGTGAGWLWALPGVSACWAGWWSALIPNSYESKARIFVQLDDALAEQVGTGVADQQARHRAHPQTLTSAVNLEKVVRATPSAPGSPKQMEGAVLGAGRERSRSSAAGKPVRDHRHGGDRLVLRCRERRLAQAHRPEADRHLPRGKPVRQSRRDVETLEFVNQQLAQREKELEAAEQKRLAFEAQHPEMAKGGAPLQRLESARAELRGIEADLAAAQSALAAINGQLAGTPKTLPGTGGGRRSGRAGAGASDLAGSLRARGLTDNHPDVIARAIRSPCARPLAEGGERRAACPTRPIPRSSRSVANARPTAGAESRAPRSSPSCLADGAARFPTRKRGRGSSASTAITTCSPAVRQAAAGPRGAAPARRGEDRARSGEVPGGRSADDAAQARRAQPPAAAARRADRRDGGGCAAELSRSASCARLSPRRRKLERASGLPVLGAISQTLPRPRARRRKRMKYFYGATAGWAGSSSCCSRIEFIQRGMVA